MEDKIYKILRNKLTADQAQKVASDIAQLASDNRVTQPATILEGMFSAVIALEGEAKLVKRPQIDPAAMELAEQLSGYVLELYPHYRRTYKQENWAKDIQALHKSDEMEYQLIEAVIRWLFTIYQPSSTFDWRQQIRSGANLRKHFLKLYDQAKSDYQATEIQEIK